MTTKIMIEIEGGLLASVTSTDDLEIYVVDHDNLETNPADEKERAIEAMSPDCICSEEELAVHLQEALDTYDEDDGLEGA